MTIPCLKCTKLTTCKSSHECEELRKFLSVDVPLRERLVSKPPRQGEDEDINDVPDIDRARKIDLGAIYQEVEEPFIEWDLIPFITSSGLSEEEEKVYKQIVGKAIPRGQIKLVKRFNAFLRCEKMTAIAKRANTSKQNVQQTFKRIIDSIAREAKRKDIPSTPNKFKKMMPTWR
jgi:hypothetical protein